MYAKYVFAVGSILALTGAYLMYDGHLLGENTGAATCS